MAGDLRARQGQAELHAAGRAEIQGDVGPPGIFGGAIVARGAGRAFLAVFVARIPGTNVVGVHEILDFGGREINDSVPTQGDVLSVDIEYPEIDAATVLPKTAFETNLFVDTRDRRKALAIERAHTLKAEGLGVDAIKIETFGEDERETAREAGVLQSQLLVLHILTREGVAAIRRRDLFVVFPERARAIVLVVAIPIVPGAHEGQHATTKIAPAGRERNGRGLAPLGAVSRARTGGEGRERFEGDSRGVGDIRRLQCVEERAGVEPWVVEEEAETDAVRVCIQRATTVDVVGIVSIEAIVEHLIFAVFGATHEELLHPFPLVEKVDGGTAERVDGVAEAFLVQLGFRVGTAVDVDADRAGEKIIVTNGGLLLMVVREFQPDRADALFDGHRNRIKGTVLAVEGAPEIVVLGIAGEALRTHNGTGRIAHRDIERIALDERWRAAGRAVGAVGRGEQGSIDPLAVGRVMEAVVGIRARAGRLFANGHAAKAPHVFKIAPFVFNANERLFERLPRRRQRLARELKRGGILKRAFLATHRVEAEGEVAPNATVNIELKTVGAVAVVEGQERGEISHDRALGEDRRLPARLDVAEDEGIGPFAEIDAFNVVGIARHIPPEVIAGRRRSAESAKGNRATLTVVFQRRRREGVSDVVGDFVRIEEPEVLHEIGGDRINIYRHILDRLLGARSGQRVVGRPSRIKLGRYDKRRQHDRFLFFDRGLGRSRRSGRALSKTVGGGG